MHVIPPYEAGFMLCHADGRFWRYKSLRALVADRGFNFLRHHLGSHFDGPLGSPYVILDSEGHLVPYHRLPLPADINEHFYYASRYHYWNGVGPVPHTGRHHKTHVHRAMRTASERRANAGACLEDGEPVARACRRGKNLPSERDDRPRSDYGNRSWKKYRRTQWKPR